MSGFEGGDQGWGSRSGVKVMRTRSVVKVGVMISGSKVGVKVGGSSSGSRSPPVVAYIFDCCIVAATEL